jgi:tRNA nucleotidyltransferase (CCA-adding enzyme)
MGGGKPLLLKRPRGTEPSRGLDPGAARLLRRAGALARARGERACLVGGCVRDLYLGRAGRDLDLVVVGDAPGLARALVSELGGESRAHAAFGTATVELPDGTRLDLATARRERYAGPAALPSVEPADLHSDLLRRDFTFNCMALDLSPRRFGELIDPCGGLEDLRAGRVRVLHDRSFIDDPTRVLRALRLAARLGFRTAPPTAKLLSAALEAGMIERLSSTRLRREIVAALEGEEAAATVRAFQRRGVWARVDPALKVGRLELARLERQRRFAVALAGPARKKTPPAWVAALALIAFERSPGQRRRLARRLRPDRRSAAMLSEGPSEARRLLRSLGRSSRPRPGTVWAACRDLSDLAIRLAWVVTGDRPLRRDLERYLAEWSVVRADIDGSDLLAAGLPAGPAIATGLRAAVRAKLDGRAAGREAQLALALRVTGRT